MDILELMFCFYAYFLCMVHYLFEVDETLKKKIRRGNQIWSKLILKAPRKQVTYLYALFISITFWLNNS